ncbi:hypothetical protein BDA99DRAFT_523117 [Phascolomyces articulosus]|uniref:Uncharacterized protein n=1 Tax=Phascolomyces articulosus TaxID=60185 RepID=A0AAD5K0E6_9FUNG|nr:hypothetical protein BDA99DRAFT_523117 [Phascolomyces articulosus]
MSTTNNRKKLDDLYRILDVDPTATNLELRDAYLKLAGRYHPDKNPEGKTKFIDISSAYQILTNPERREQYLVDKNDSCLYRAEPSDRSFEAFIEALTESFYRQKEKYRIEKLCKAADIGLNLYAHQCISLEDIYLGQEVTVKYTRMVICQQCHGHGKTPIYIQCTDCHGTGYVTVKRKKKKRRSYVNVNVEVACNRCGQKGRVRKYEQCSKCHSNKYVEMDDAVQVRVLMGGPTDGKIRVSKRGHETHGEQSILSDLIVLLYLRHHPRLHWKTGTSTLVARVPITLTEALLGLDRVVVVHLDGRKIKVYQPTGKIIRPGTVMRIPGEGMRFGPSSTGTTNSSIHTWKKNNLKMKPNGDLLVEFDIQYPDKLNLTTYMIEQLANILPLCIPPEQDTESIYFERSTDSGSLLGRPIPSALADDSSGTIVERVMIEENLDDKSDIMKKALSMHQDGFCPHCATKPLFDEKMFKTVASCCVEEPTIGSLSEALFNNDADDDYYDYEEEDYDLYS